MEKIGVVEKFFANISVAAITLEAPLKVGDKIAVQGATTNFEQTIDSMQIEMDKVEEAKKGDSIGIKVKDRVRPNDAVYKVE